MQNSNRIPQNLSSMLRQVNAHEGFKRFIKKTSEKMNFQKKNILNLTQEKVEILYVALKTKLQNTQYTDQTTKNLENSIWLQNQLRIFIYIMCAHLYLKKITIHELVILYLRQKLQDYILLNEFFPNKRPQHLQYQIKLLVCNKNAKWSLQESKLFKEIMKMNQDSKRWNYIAKELYIRSNKKYFKTPKQCRQRWINHEDPSKLKGNWSNEEDSILLRSVMNLGKKWTLIAKELNETRTQNSVKNRYNSLIKIAKKQYGIEKTQQSLIENLLATRNVQQIKYQVSMPQNSKVEFGNNIIMQHGKQQINKIIDNQLIKKDQQKIAVQKLQKIQIEGMPDKLNIFSSSLFEGNDFKYVFDQSEQLQNISWNVSQPPFKLNQQFYFMNGFFSFDQEKLI